MNSLVFLTNRKYLYTEIVKLRFLLCLICIMLLSLAGCAHVVSQDMRTKAEPGIDMALFFADPEAYLKRTVILGGVIASSWNVPEGTYIEVLQKPLDYRDIPEDTDISYGRFLVIYNGYLDTAIYAPGRLITVAGEVIGKKSGTLEEMPYHYPLIRGREVHLIDRSSSPPISFGIGIFKSF
jgi:outer membrane lipoprotein